MKIKNFSIIAHIDHGKSTLADRFLEITQTVPKEKMLAQYLDRLDLERERGITIKMQPVRMHWLDYEINLIDTPGHTDFFYEVSRALKAVEGAILLVDGLKGIQAQTIANLNMAKKMNLKIIPAINKIDLEISNLDYLKKELSEITNVAQEKISLISAKTGQGVKELLEKVIGQIPLPKMEINKPFKAMVFDSTFDPHLGIIAYIRVFEGEVSAKEKLMLFSEKYSFEAKQVGFFAPDFKKTNKLLAGEIGWIATGIKKPGLLQIGETIVQAKAYKENKVSALEGYKKPQPLVFASVFPKDSKEFDLLKFSLEKLALNDSSFSYKLQHSPVLGRGFLIGALGLLHLDIISERLKRHFKVETAITWPSVLYKVELKNGKIVEIEEAERFPEQQEIKQVLEPWVKIIISFPSRYLGAIFNLLEKYRFVYLKEEERDKITYLEGEVSLSEIVKNFYDDLKSQSQGFASYTYQLSDWKPADISKMEIHLAGKKQFGLSWLVIKENAYIEGKKMVKKLKELLPREQFSVAIQAVWKNKVIARETLPALRKDVTGYLYGGDRTRKMKLWQKQKKGKKALKEMGQVRLSSDVFIKMLSKE